MGCINYDSGTDRATIPGNTAMQNATDFTVMSWNKLNSLTAPNSTFKIGIWVADFNFNVGNSDGIWFSYDEERQAPSFDETWRWGHHGSDGDNENFHWQSFRAHTYWQNVCYAIESNVAPETYWDGDTQQSGTTPAPADAGQETRDYVLGNQPGFIATNLRCDTRMNHFRWWTSTLPKQVVSWAVHRPSAIVENLECYLPLWSNASTETDISGNGHHATVTGAGVEADGAPVFY